MLITDEILKESSLYRHALEEGRLQGERDSLRRLLTKKFGAPSDIEHQRIEKADADTLNRWIEQVLTSSTIEEALR